MEILTVEQMARCDALASSMGRSTADLMRSAGQRVAAAAQALAGEGPILIVAGRGNNGGDGFIAAAELAALGRDVTVMLLCARETLAGDAAEAATCWTGPVLPFAPDALGRPVLIIDALFGAGLNRIVKGDPRRMIEAINATGCPVLSVDLPSGINGDTGEVMGVAIRATETITFFRPKPGHLLLPGRVCCGHIGVAEIGIDAAILGQIKPDTFENVPELWTRMFPVPAIDGHKYARGHAVIVSGPDTATGAARLAARGALRVGAGLVTMASPTSALPVNAATLTAIMLRKVDDAAAFADLLSDRRLNSVVVGPGAGIGAQTRAFVVAAMRSEAGIVLDADALTSFAEQPDDLFIGLKARSAAAVLTPHTGEFSCLFKLLCNNSHFKSKLEKARAAARAAHSIVLIKGADTVIAAPDGRAAIAANAPPWLATAGAGDVLSGMIGGMLAQGVPAFEAACIGVWMHGEAGREAGPGLIAEDLPDVLPAVVRGLYDRIGIRY